MDNRFVLSRGSSCCRLYILGVLFFWVAVFLPRLSFAQIYDDLRQNVINQTLDIVESRENIRQRFYEEPTEVPEQQQVQTSQPYQPTFRQEAPFEPFIFGQEDKSDKEVKELFFGKDGIGTLSVGLESGKIDGLTKYRISFENPYAYGGHGESQLEWPINSYLIGFSAALHYQGLRENRLPHDKMQLGFRWLTHALGHRTGNIKDSDWIENDVGYIDDNDDPAGLNGSSAWATNNDGLDIYSDSPARLNGADIIDITYLYNFVNKENWTFGPVFGYRTQKFNFAIYNVDQIGYGPYGPGPFDQSYQDDVGRKWGEYEARYYLPYLGFNSAFSINNRLSLFFNFGYSAWAQVEDKDAHLYPTEDEALGINHDMISTGSSRGKAYLLGGEGSWELSPGWFWNLGANYVTIKASGETIQHHYLNGILVVESEPICEKVRSNYWLINTSLKYRF